MFDALWLRCIDDDSDIAHLEDLVWEDLVAILARLKGLNAFALFRFAFAGHQIYLLQC